jgi:pimeloyl-ACP methyl ester carboxylesterase
MSEPLSAGNQRYHVGHSHGGFVARNADNPELPRVLEALQSAGSITGDETDIVQNRELLAGLTVPALVIAGRYDVICGERWGREIRDLVPGSRLAILPESGHMGHLEEPEAFAAAVADFVAATK